MPAITVATAVVRPQLFIEMARRPIAWFLVAVAVAGSFAIVVGQRREREGLAFLGGCAFIAGLLGAAAASVFPIMLHSTFDAAYSINAYAGAVGGPGLGLAILWWPVAMVLSVAYSAFVLRQFKGKVRMAGPSSN
jgi:cytochrome bd-type quinol oxidase subunit 2